MFSESVSARVRVGISRSALVGYMNLVQLNGIRCIQVLNENFLHFTGSPPVNLIELVLVGKQYAVENNVSMKGYEPLIIE